MGGLNIHGKEKKYGIAYLVPPGIGGLTSTGYRDFRVPKDKTAEFPPKRNVEVTVTGPDGNQRTVVYKAQQKVTFQAGEVIPPEVIYEATPEERDSWGWKPHEQMLPIKLAGLSRPEDFVKNPKYRQEVLEKFQEYVESLDYKEYAASVGGKLYEMVAKDVSDSASKMNLVEKLGYDVGDSHEDSLLRRIDTGKDWKIERLEKDRNRHKKRAEKLKQEAEQLKKAMTLLAKHPNAKACKAIREAHLTNNMAKLAELVNQHWREDLA